MKYDVMQVEDDSDDRATAKWAVERSGWSYLGVSSLCALEAALAESSARVYVIDGNFPVVERGCIFFNAPNAFDAIRKMYGDARIIFFSGHPSGNEIAVRHNVEFVDKDVFTVKDLVSKIKEILEPGQEAPQKF